MINYFLVSNQTKNITIKQEQILFKIYDHVTNKSIISNSYSLELKDLLASASNIKGYIFKNKVNATCNAIKEDEQFIKLISRYMIFQKETSLLQADFIAINTKLNANDAFNQPAWNLDLIRLFVKNVNTLKPMVDSCYNALIDLQIYKTKYIERKMSPELTKRYIDFFVLLENDMKSYADTGKKLDEMQSNPAFRNPLVSDYSTSNSGGILKSASIESESYNAKAVNNFSEGKYVDITNSKKSNNNSNVSDNKYIGKVMSVLNSKHEFTDFESRQIKSIAKVKINNEVVWVGSNELDFVKKGQTIEFNDTETYIKYPFTANKQQNIELDKILIPKGVIRSY